MQALVDLLSSSLAQRIGWALIHFLWQGTLVALLLAAVMQFLRHRSPQVRWFLACTAFGLMAVLPVVTAYTVSVDIPNVAEIEPLTEATTLPDSTPLVAAETELPFVAVGDPASPEVPSELPGDGAGLASTTPWLQQAKNFLHPILPWGVLVWLLGVVGISLWHFGGWLLLEKTKRLGTRPVAPAIRNILDQLLQRLRISRPIRLLESARVAVPVVVGWLRPVVLLPASLLSGLTPSQLEAILAHELAHIRRFDCLVKLIQAVIETFLFYHPAVWWISAHIRQESEHCCDELAVEICPDRKSYAHALARIAELTSRKPRLAAAASGGKLLSRIRRIVGLAEDHAGSGVRWLAGILVMVSLIVAGLIIYGNSAIGQTEIQPTTQPTAGVKELSWSKPFVINVQPGVKEPRWSKPFPTNVQSDMAVATAYEYWNKGEYELAIRDFDKAIKLDPSNASAYNDRGLVYLIKDDYDAAIRNFSQAIELNPRNAEPYHNRAVAYCAKEMYDHAIRYFDMAIALNPRNAEAYNSRGFAYMRRGNRDQAIRDFKRAVSLNPKYAPAQKNLSLAEQHKAQIPWGAPVEGVQVCLRADQNQWEVGQIPGFRVDMRNGAERHLELVLSEDHWEIELDGTWFRASVIRLYDPEKRRLGPGAIQEDIPFAPVEWAQWRSRPGNKPIEFTAGKHVIRLAFTANPSGEDEGLSVRAVSNPVEIEIQPATQPTKLELEKTAIEQGSQHIYEVYGTVYDCVLDSLWEDWLAGLETAESEEEFRRAFLEIENMQRPDHHPAAGVVVTLRGGSFTKETVTDGEGKFKFSGLPKEAYELFCEKTVISTKTGQKLMAVAQGGVGFKSAFYFPGRKVDFRLRSDLITVRGRITDVDGRGIAGAKVTGIQEINDQGAHGPNMVSTRSSTDGSYELQGLNPMNFYQTMMFLIGGDPTREWRSLSLYLVVRVEADGFVQDGENVPRFPLVTEEMLYWARRLLKAMNQFQTRVKGSSELGEKEGLALPSSTGNTITGIDIVLKQSKAATQAARAAEERSKPGLIGTWTKQHSQEEDHAYPGDTNWHLELTFRENGQFVWRSSRTDGTNRIDESLTGTYSLERGMMIIYRFDKPSDAASKRLAEWFAYWPSKLEGQHTFRLEKDFLILGHDGRKLRFYMKRKNI